MTLVAPPSSQSESPSSAEWRLPSREQFGRYVEGNLPEVMRGLEGTRHRMIWRSMVGIPLVLPLAAASIFVGGALHANPELLPYGVGTVAVILIIGWAYLSIKPYKKEFKTRLIAPLVKFLGADFKYTTDSFVDSDRYWASGIFTTRFDRYSGQDHIVGTAGRTRFECSEVHVEQEIETMGSSSSSRSKKWRTVFRGLFLVADLNQEFSGNTWVFPDPLESKLGRLGRKLQEWNPDRPGDLVKLGDPEFERLFVVYASDPAAARQVLSPSLMRAITEYRRKLKRPLWMAFKDGVVYLAISPGRNLFEPKLLSVVDRKQCMSIFDDIAIALGLIESLNLGPSNRLAR